MDFSCQHYIWWGMCPFPAAAAVLAFGVLTCVILVEMGQEALMSACFPVAGGWEHSPSGKWSGMMLWGSRQNGTAACMCSFVTQLWHGAQRATSGEVKQFLSPNKPLDK